MWLAMNLRVERWFFPEGLVPRPNAIAVNSLRVSAALWLTRNFSLAGMLSVHKCGSRLAVCPLVMSFLATDTRAVRAIAWGLGRARLYAPHRIWRMFTGNHNPHRSVRLALENRKLGHQKISD
jgi:hypothetical protein